MVRQIVRIDLVEKDLNVEILTAITERARVCDAEFLGMGVSNDTLILKWAKMMRDIKSMKIDLNAIVNGEIC